VAVIDTHPYDFYTPRVVGGVKKRWKRAAHLRNGDRAFEVFGGMLRALADRGYAFHYMSEACAMAESRADLRAMPIEAVA
jgi:hypothetical protein